MRDNNNYQILENCLEFYFDKMPKELPEKDFELLLRKTKFSRPDIMEWFTVFMEECPDGFLYRRKVHQMFKGKFLLCYHQH